MPEDCDVAAAAAVLEEVPVAEAPVADWPDDRRNVDVESFGEIVLLVSEGDAEVVVAESDEPSVAVDDPDMPASEDEASAAASLASD